MNIYIALTTSNTTGAWYDATDVKVIKTDANGTVLWSKEIDLPNNEGPSDIVYNSLAGSVIVAASESANGNSLLASLNPSTGVQNWLTYSGSYSHFYKIAIKPNGEIFATGDYGDNNVGPNNWGRDILLARFSAAGVLLETKTTGLVDTVDHGDGITFDTNGNYFITGVIGCALITPCTFNGVSMYGMDDAFILKNLP